MWPQAITGTQQQHPVGDAGACQPLIELSVATAAQGQVLHAWRVNPVEAIRHQHQYLAGGIGLCSQAIQGGAQCAFIPFAAGYDRDDGRLYRPLLDPLGQQPQLPVRQVAAGQPFGIELGKAEGVAAYLLREIGDLAGMEAADVQLLPGLVGPWIVSLQRQVTHPAIGRRRLAGARRQHLLQPLGFMLVGLGHARVMTEPAWVNALHTQYALQARQVPTAQQACVQGQVQPCGEPLATLYQLRQVFQHLGTAEQHMADATEQVRNVLGDAGQQVRTDKHGTLRGDDAVERTGRQEDVISRPEQTLTDHHAELRPLRQNLRLPADATVEQQVVITQELHQLPVGLLQARLQVTCKPQPNRVARIAHGHRSTVAERLADSLDLGAGAVIANDDFQVGIVLAKRTDQGCLKKIGIEGRNGDTDEWLL